MFATFFGILVCLLPVFLIWQIFRFRIPKGLTLFVGVPGSGKTTLCARLKVLHSKSLKLPAPLQRFGRNFFCNVPIVGAQKISPDYMGRYLIEDGIVAFDEAGIDLNNRNWKSLNNNVIKFAKYYRHYGLKAFCLFSQGMDIDVTFVRLADRIGIVTKSILPYFIQVRYARKVVGIDDTTHQLVDMYKWRLFGRKFVFAPTCWKYFDTYEKPQLPKFNFPLFDGVTRHSFIDDAEPKAIKPSAGP